MYEGNFNAFIVASLLFLLIAVYTGRSISSVKEYFHRTGDIDWFLSLSAANITLGTGVVYYLSSSGRFGWLMLLSPLMVLTGYLLFARLLTKRQNLQSSTEGNFLKWIDAQIVPLPDSRFRRVSFFPTLSLVLTFILILAYEIYASATIFSQILFKASDSQTTIFLAALIAVITMIYALWGGVVAVLKTDRIQIIGVVAVIFLLIYATFVKVSDPAYQFSATLLPNSSEIFWGVSAAICGAIATQFYSLLNWGAVSNFPTGHCPSKTLRATGISTFILLGALVLVGLYAGGGHAGVSFKSLVDAPFLASPGMLTYALVAGMVCIVFSTADSLMIQITMFTYDNLLGRNSMSDTTSLPSVRNLRLLALGTFTLALSAVIVFIATQQDLLYLLFAVAGGIIVYAPFMFIALVIAKNPKALSALEGLPSFGFFALFLLAFAANIGALIFKPELTAMVVTLSFVVASMGAFLLYKRTQV